MSNQHIFLQLCQSSKKHLLYQLYLFHYTLQLKNNFPFFTTFYYLDYCGISSATTATNRIVGGESAKPHEFPWLVGKKHALK